MTTFKTTTLRPGLLVSLKTSIDGNVSYAKETLEAEHVTEEGAARARWETVRVITDPAEHEAATKARSQARSIIAGICAKSAFGMLCPEDRASELEQAVAQARVVAERFNQTAKLTRVTVNIMTGRIAPDDVEAVRAINSEVRDLLDEMKRGVEALDAKVIRDAAKRAVGLGSMLSPEAAKRIDSAIVSAREAAKKIVKAGETAATVIDETDIRRITEARTAFLDLDDNGQEIKVAALEGRAVDLEPVEVLTPGRKAAITRKRREAARQIEL